MLYGMHVSQLTRSTALVMFVPMLGLAGWGSWFGSRCFSDGCLGVLVAWLAAVVAFVVQALLVLPTHAWALKRQGAPAARSYFLWLGASAVAAFLPIVLGWGYLMIFR
ncbi:MULTISPECIES: hypothetical protein [Stenotrophomonas]|uniref:hypothetical protein n=1 Tax=Stenotrophomonas TaxID=40323 RepID=UPI0018D48964|nr:hypothetical protein [Stenotrophomonas sp.]MBH1507841.1 hypothetical protein [Stenotrophomonas maltophilia]